MRTQAGGSVRVQFNTAGVAETATKKPQAMIALPWFLRNVAQH